VLMRGEERETSGTRILSRSVSRSLKAMMKATVDVGTGRRSLARARLASAAKSGTLSAHRDGKLRHYTWMVGYFPTDAPEIAYAAMVVNADVWHFRAGDLARAGIDAWASARKKRP
jgi:cell division protein FtsI/penicillin-binding protein 2